MTIIKQSASLTPSTPSTVSTFGRDDSRWINPRRLWLPDSYENAVKLYDRFDEYIRGGGTTTGASICSNQNHHNSLSVELLEHAVRSVNDTLRLYGPKKTIASFNGGKDATIILYLYTACLANYYRQNPSIKPEAPKALYFYNSEEFDDIADFIDSTTFQLGVDLGVYIGSFRSRVREALTDLIVIKEDTQEDSNKKNECNNADDSTTTSASTSSSTGAGAGGGGGGLGGHPAIFLGLRRGDPWSESVGVFEPSSSWLDARFMRVHPILEWSYGAVWEFLDEFDIKYCSLYDLGYTSLGSRQDTRPNRMLIQPNGVVLPAKALLDWSNERDGRGADL